MRQAHQSWLALLLVAAGRGPLARAAEDCEAIGADWRPADPVTSAEDILSAPLCDSLESVSAELDPSLTHAEVGTLIDAFLTRWPAWTVAEEPFSWHWGGDGGPRRFELRRRRGLDEVAALFRSVQFRDECDAAPHVPRTSMVISHDPDRYWASLMMGWGDQLFGALNSDTVFVPRFSTRGEGSVPDTARSHDWILFDRLPACPRGAALPEEVFTCAFLPVTNCRAPEDFAASSCEREHHRDGAKPEHCKGELGVATTLLYGPPAKGKAHRAQDVLRFSWGPIIGAHLLEELGADKKRMALPLHSDDVASVQRRAQLMHLLFRPNYALREAIARDTTRMLSAPYAITRRDGAPWDMERDRCVVVHIRRGDKLTKPNGKFDPKVVQQYLWKKEPSEYLQCAGRLQHIIQAQHPDAAKEAPPPPIFIMTDDDPYVRDKVEGLRDTRKAPKPLLGGTALYMMGGHGELRSGNDGFDHHGEAFGHYTNESATMLASTFLAAGCDGVVGNSHSWVFRVLRCFTCLYDPQSRAECHKKPRVDFQDERINGDSCAKMGDTTEGEDPSGWRRRLEDLEANWLEEAAEAVALGR